MIINFFKHRYASVPLLYFPSKPIEPLRGVDFFLQFFSQTLFLTTSVYNPIHLLDDNFFLIHNIPLSFPLKNTKNAKSSQYFRTYAWYFPTYVTCAVVKHVN